MAGKIGFVSRKNLSKTATLACKRCCIVVISKMCAIKVSTFEFASFIVIFFALFANLCLNSRW